MDLHGVACGRCDNCTGGCEFTCSAHQVASDLMSVSSVRRDFNLLLTALESACVCPSKSHCNGSRCGDGRCYICGGDHMAFECSARERYTVGGLQVCQSCMCPHGARRSAEDCKSNRCKMGKRLARLLKDLYYEQCHGANKADGGERHKEWIRDMYSDPDLFYVKCIGHVRASEKHCKLI